MNRCKVSVVLLVAFVSLSAVSSRAQLVAGNPASVSDLILWLDASDAGTVTEAGGSISAWANKAPGSSNVVTSTPSDQPQWVTWPENGNANAIRFDGSGDALRDLAFGETAQEVTIFIVAAPRVNDGLFQAFLSANQAGQVDWITGFTIDQTVQASSEFDRINFEGPKRSVPGGGDFFDGSYPFRSAHVLHLGLRNSTSDLRVDGAIVGTQVTKMMNPIAMDQIRVGARYWVNPSTDTPFERSYFDGDIAEVLLYSRALSEGESALVESYLFDKYEIDPAPQQVPASSALARVVLSLLLVAGGAMAARPVRR